MLSRDAEYKLVNPPPVERFFEYMTSDVETGLNITFTEEGDPSSAFNVWVKSSTIKKVSEALARYIISGETVTPPGLVFEIDLDPFHANLAGTITFKDPSR
jgi:hypothetical protein